MKTYIHVRDSDKAVVGVGMIYMEDGSHTPGAEALISELGEDEGILAIGRQSAPSGCHVRVVDTAYLPGNGLPDATFDKTFLGWPDLRDGDGNQIMAEQRGWTDAFNGPQVDVEIMSAREIAHMRRRIKRAEDFAEHDEVIAKQIPGKDVAAAEAARQAIRDADAVTQANINACADEASLKAEMAAKGLL